MKVYFLVIALILFAFTGLNAQGFAWNQAVTAGDTMDWDNGAVVLYYQIHPYVNSTGITEPVTATPIKASRFWTGSNNGTRRDSLATIATTNLDSLARIIVITNQTNYTWGGWQRFILTDGTHTDTSSAVRIGNKAGALTVFYYFDDVSTNKILQWLLVQGQ